MTDGCKEVEIGGGEGVKQMEVFRNPIYIKRSVNAQSVQPLRQPDVHQRSSTEEVTLSFDTTGDAESAFLFFKLRLELLHTDETHTQFVHTEGKTKMCSFQNVIRI